MTKRNPETEDMGPLGRWSQRKAAARDAAAEQAATLRQATACQAPAEDCAADAPTEADLPPLETLDERSDFRGFLSPRVSEELHRLALRKLFHLPAFHVRDGLDDYDGDYRNFVPLGDTLTAELGERVERAAGHAVQTALAACEDPASTADASARDAADAAPATGCEAPDERGPG